MSSLLDIFRVEVMVLASCCSQAPEGKDREKRRAWHLISPSSPLDLWQSLEEREAEPEAGFLRDSGHPWHFVGPSDLMAHGQVGRTQHGLLHKPGRTQHKVGKREPGLGTGAMLPQSTSQ